MDPVLKMGALGAIVLLASTTEAITGFGSTIISLTLGAHLFPIGDLIPLIVTLHIPACLMLAARHRDDIDREVLSGSILPWMGLGLAAGLAVAGLLQGGELRHAFGLLIVVLAARELSALLDGPRRREDMSGGAFRFWVAAAGVVHGVYATGGPMLTYALSRKRMGRAALRATLVTVWLILNIAVLASCYRRGTLTADTARRALTLLPVVPMGILLGERLHAKVPEFGFKVVVQSVLALSGAALLI